MRKINTGGWSWKILREKDRVNSRHSVYNALRKSEIRNWK
jgi:hypothetical protein